MARPLSLDLRERIVAAIEGGLSRRAAASRFAVSESCAIKLVRRWKHSGSVERRGDGRPQAVALARHEKLVRDLVAARSRHTLGVLRDRLAAGGVGVGRRSIHRYLEALGMTLKKRHSMPPSRTARMSPRRARRGRGPARLNPDRLVFIDETWAKTNMARTYGRAPRGERLRRRAARPLADQTFLAGLRCDAVTAPCVIDGPINGLTFQAYVEQVLVPTLVPGDVVIMDNLGSHKGGPVRAAIEGPAQHCSTCRPTAPTSTQSSSSSPSSRPCSQSCCPDLRRLVARRRRAPRLDSNQANAPTTSVQLRL